MKTKPNEISSINLLKKWMNVPISNQQHNNKDKDGGKI